MHKKNLSVDPKGGDGIGQVGNDERVINSK